MYYGNMNSLNEMAALSDGEAAMMGMSMGDVDSAENRALLKQTEKEWQQMLKDEKKAADAAKPRSASVWTPEMVATIGQTLTKGIQDVGTLNIQRIYAQKGIMIPNELNPQMQQQVVRSAPWPAWSKWLIAGGAVLLVGALVFKATRGSKAPAADFQI